FASIGYSWFCFFFFQAEDGIRDFHVSGVQTCALPICEGIAEDEEMAIKNPKITFDKGFLVNVDFNNDGLKDYIIRSSEVTCEGRSEERRVGKECRTRWMPGHEKKDRKKTV